MYNFNIINIFLTQNIFFSICLWHTIPSIDILDEEFAVRSVSFYKFNKSLYVLLRCEMTNDSFILALSLPLFFLLIWEDVIKAKNEILSIFADMECLQLWLFKISCEIRVSLRKCEKKSSQLIIEQLIWDSIWVYASILSRTSLLWLGNHESWMIRRSLWSSAIRSLLKKWRKGTIIYRDVSKEWNYS